MAKILVVDDSAFNRSLVSRPLVSAGHVVIEAADGVQAVDKYEDERPDAVLMDINMPRMDGLNALVSIRKHDPKARVAMLTALAEKQVAFTAIKMGARDFVIKPFKEDRMLAAIQRMLEHPLKSDKR